MSKDGDDPDLVTDNCDNHTPCPSGYFEWYDWSKMMTKNHRQVECGECGLFAIWIPKKEGLADEK